MVLLLPVVSAVPALYPMQVLLEAEVKDCMQYDPTAVFCEPLDVAATPMRA